MSDRRFWAANDRVAHTSLEGQVPGGLRLTDGTSQTVIVPHSDLCVRPNGARDKQFLFGQAFVALESLNGWTFGFDPVDGYVGYLSSSNLTAYKSPTHRIRTRLAHVYSEPDMKSKEIATLSFFSELEVTATENKFCALSGGGFVPMQQVVPLSWCADDAARIAEMFLGTPYLWGGNTGAGIDCSGLVQLCLYAIGRACPRDSDLQAQRFAQVEPDGLMRGDLVFWNGHVGILRDAHTLIHANAHHMCVVSEPLKDAVERIGRNEFGSVTAYARPVGYEGH